MSYKVEALQAGQGSSSGVPEDLCQGNHDVNFSGDSIEVFL